MDKDYKISETPKEENINNEPEEPEYVDPMTLNNPKATWDNFIKDLSLNIIENEEGIIDINPNRMNEINELLRASLGLIINPHIPANEIQNELYLQILLTLFQKPDITDETLLILVNISERLFILQFNEKLYNLAIETAKICTTKSGNIQLIALSAIYQLMSDKRKENIQFRLDVHQHITRDLLQIFLTSSDILLIRGILLYFEALLFLFSQLTIDYHQEFENEFVPIIGAEIISHLIPYNETVTPAAIKVVSNLSYFPTGCEFLISQNIHNLLFQLNVVHRQILSNYETNDTNLSRDIYVATSIYELFYRFSNFEGCRQMQVTIFNNPEFPDMVKYELAEGHHTTREIIFKLIYTFIVDYGQYFEETGIMHEVVIRFLQGVPYNERVSTVNILLTHFTKAPHEVIEKYMTSDIILAIVDVVENPEDNKKMMEGFCETMISLIHVFPHVFEILDNEEFHDSLTEFIDNNKIIDHAVQLLSMLEPSDEN